MAKKILINGSDEIVTKYAVNDSHGHSIDVNDLQTQINNLKSVGRFLSIWDCQTGTPLTEPTTPLPYPYKAGDFYIISNVGATNYIPEGTSYTGTPSTTVYTGGELLDNDFFLFDSNAWIRVANTPISVTWGNIGGILSSQQDLQTALNAKSSVSVSPTGTATDEVTYITIDGVEKKIAGAGAGNGGLYKHSFTYRYSGTAYGAGDYPCYTIDNRAEPYTSFSQVLGALKIDGYIGVVSNRYCVWGGNVSLNVVLAGSSAKGVAVADFSFVTEDVVTPYVETVIPAPVQSGIFKHSLAVTDTTSEFTNITMVCYNNNPNQLGASTWWSEFCQSMSQNFRATAGARTYGMIGVDPVDMKVMARQIDGSANINITGANFTMTDDVVTPY